jgi:hypothetical protein
MQNGFCNLHVSSGGESHFYVKSTNRKSVNSWYDFATANPQILSCPQIPNLSIFFNNPQISTNTAQLCLKTEVLSPQKNIGITNLQRPHISVFPIRGTYLRTAHLCLYRTGKGLANDGFSLLR